MASVRFFYRDLITQSIRELERKEVSPGDFVFVETSALDNIKRIYCNECGRLFKVSSFDFDAAVLECTHSIHGPFAEYPVYLKKSCDGEENFSFADDFYSDFLDNVTPSKFGNIVKSTIERKKNQLEENFFLDENCIPKNQFLYEISIDDKDFKMQIIFHEKKVQELSSGRICFDLRDGTVSGDLKCAPNIPLEILNFAFHEFVKLISVWCGFSVTVQCESISFAFLKNLARFPFCPGISDIIDSDVLSTFHGKCDRTNPECYKELCKSLKLDDCKTVRKSFSRNPKNLLAYKVLKVSGFKDVNIISQALGSPLALEITGFNFESYIFFFRKAMRRCGEKKLLNIMLSNLREEKYYLDDGVLMFRKYYRKLDRCLKKTIYGYGFTELAHDTLAVISTSFHKKNVRFKYSAEQKSLEDDVGEFEFRLPKDSRKLIELGVELHNCVASYAQRILEKECTVIYAVRDKKYEICIELRGREVCQKLGKYNSRLSGVLEDVMEKYMMRHDLV